MISRLVELSGYPLYLYSPEPSLPTVVRVALSPAAEGRRVEFIKVRGGRDFEVTLPLLPACS